MRISAGVHNIPSTMPGTKQELNRWHVKSFFLERFLGRDAGRLGETEALKLSQPEAQMGVASSVQPPSALSSPFPHRGLASFS